MIVEQLGGTISFRNHTNFDEIKKELKVKDKKKKTVSPDSEGEGLELPNRLAGY